MTITETTTPRRTHRPKQPENALPDPALKPRYCCAHSKGEPADAPHRVIVVDSVRFDPTREGGKGDHRIGYYNEATGRRGESWYASFRSGAEFFPAPPVDRAQAIRDALIAALSDGWRDEQDLRRAVINSPGWDGPAPANIGAALASIGAVYSVHSWRLSDGLPPGWEWFRIHAYREVLTQGEGKGLIAAVNYSPARDIAWEDGYTDQCTARTVASVADGKAAAIAYARRAGLFAPPHVMVEKPADPQPVAAPAVAVPTVATAPASHPTSQLPLTLAVHPVDGARALALLERLTVAAEAVARYVTTDCAAREPTAPTIAKPANANAA